MPRWWDAIRDLTDRLSHPREVENLPDSFYDDTVTAGSDERYWDNELEDIFSQVDPAVPGGFDAEFTPTDEKHGRDLFYDGWVNPELDRDEREEAREKFYDWMTEFDVDEPFPWEDWRDWYESA